jgi:hypothetical protein
MTSITEQRRVHPSIWVRFKQWLRDHGLLVSNWLDDVSDWAPDLPEKDKHW